jgi:AcrR family transcriptional regulator
MTTRDDRPTRDRLKAAALTLFSERGFRATTVGDLEAAAGLTRRGGGFYKHFASKQDVLEAILEGHLNQLETTENVMALMPLGDLRAELTLLARWGLQQIQNMRPLVRILQRETTFVPRLVERYRDEVVRRGYALSAEWLRRQFKEMGLPDRDFDALATIAVGSIINYRWEEVLFGLPPADVDEERFVQTFVDLWTTYARGLGLEVPPP